MLYELALGNRTFESMRVRAIGSDLHIDYTAVGHTTHLAARMEQIADPGAIVITPDTLALVEGYVEVKPLGPVAVKGLAEPVEVYEMTGAGPARTRLQATARRGLTRFVGRDVELQQLRRVQQLAAIGHGQLAAIVGEAGVGKSRLVYEFTHSHGLEGWLVLESTSFSYGRATGYLPVIELLKSYFKIEDGDGSREIREKVTAKLYALDRALEPTLPALLALLDAPTDAAWQALASGARRQGTLNAVKRLLLREAIEQPVLLVIEDLHLVDTETQMLLDGLVETLGAARLLLLVNYRPEYMHAWGSRTCYSHIRLDALHTASAGELLDMLLGRDPGLAPIKQLLVKRGNPFFLEEAVRTLVETKALAGERGHYRLTQPVHAIQVPPTVQAVLAARIDRLPVNEKHLLQVASVLGKEVPFALLETIADLTPESLRSGLDHLQTAEFLYETRLFPDLAYAFRHALTLDVVYGAILRSRRRDLHAHIVSAIERLYAEPSGTPVERLADHAFRGELWDKALTYGREAARRAFAKSAVVEALGHVDHALEALTHLDDAPELKRAELALVTQRATALRTLHGYGASEVERVYLKARELSREIPDMPEWFGLEWQQMQFFLVRAELDSAKGLASKLLEHAEARGERSLLIDAHLASGMVQCPAGEFAAARDHFERGLELCVPETVQPNLMTHGQCPDVFCLGFLGWTPWFLGWPERAKTCAEAAVELARLRDHTFTYVSALMFAARVHQGRRDMDRVRTLAAQIVTLSRDSGFAYYEAQGRIHEGWAQVMLEGDPAGYKQLQEGLTALYRTGTVLGVPGALVQAAEVCQRLARIDEARGMLTRIHDRGRGPEVRCWDAEIARLTAELAGHESAQDFGAAAHWYRMAVETAQAQGARSLELRAALAYARAPRPSDSGNEARELLTTALGHFPEAAGTRELREAHSLLTG